MIGVLCVCVCWFVCQVSSLNQSRALLNTCVSSCVLHANINLVELQWADSSSLCVPPGGVILYAGSSGSASPSPGSPSSGYQTQSPSSHSQPSSPEGVSFQEIGALKQRGEQGGGNPSPRMVFQFPEVNNAPVAQISTVSSATYNHPTVAKRPCGLTGTFTSKCPTASPLPALLCLPASTLFLCSSLMRMRCHDGCVPLSQRRAVWCFCARCAGTSRLGSIMECTPAKAAR